MDFYNTPDLKNRKYEEMGIITTNQTVTGISAVFNSLAFYMKRVEEDAMEDLKNKAIKMQADAVVNLNIQVLTGNGYLGIYAVGTAIRFL